MARGVTATFASMATSREDILRSNMLLRANPRVITISLLSTSFLIADLTDRSDAIAINGISDVSSLPRRAIAANIADAVCEASVSATIIISCRDKALLGFRYITMSGLPCKVRTSVARFTSGRTIETDLCKMPCFKYLTRRASDALPILLRTLNESLDCVLPNV